MLYEKMRKADKLVTSKYTINWDKKLIIAGPCSFGGYEELLNIAKELKKRKIEFMRAGTFKLRTDPYAFQGLGDKGMEILLKVKKETGLRVVTELTSIDEVKKYGNKIDIIQIGTRNMYNYALLKAVGKTKTPVILKWGFSATYKEWFLAAEYILKEGNPNVILCERGIRNNISDETRNVLDIQAIPYIKHNTNFRVLVDPSHASGIAYMVEPMSKAALVAGCDGLLIETHIHPEESLSDSKQTIDFNTLDEIIKFRDNLKKD